ncbi:MAG TPA: nucleoside deaminase [Clostridia bacterium]|nr:nucleoside deaminase [Clostridia bacterium]
MPWTALSTGWRAALEQMFRAWTEGCLPIGAAIADPEGRVVAAGRNAIGGGDGSMPVHGHCLAHAELNAILQLDEEEYPAIRTYTLYTTLEPCPLCFGAAVMGHIRHIVYAGRDPVGGAAGLNDSIPYVRNKNLRVEGPVETLEAVSYAFKTVWALERPDLGGRMLTHYIDACPSGVRVGEKLFVTGALKRIVQDGGGMAEAYEWILRLLEGDRTALAFGS